MSACQSLCLCLCLCTRIDVVYTVPQACRHHRHTQSWVYCKYAPLSSICLLLQHAAMLGRSCMHAFAGTGPRHFGTHCDTRPMTWVLVQSSNRLMQCCSSSHWLLSLRRRWLPCCTQPFRCSHLFVWFFYEAAWHGAPCMIIAKSAGDVLLLLTALHRCVAACHTNARHGS